MDAHERNAEIIRTIVALGGNLGIDVIAEGVESSRQLERLRGLGCRFGQGFYFSHPVDSAAATTLLSASRVLAQA